eukprot:1143682-Pelagomonas_calceolata.AAC.1
MCWLAGGVLAVGLGSAKNGIVAMFESSMHVPPALTASKSASNRAPWLQPFVIAASKSASNRASWLQPFVIGEWKWQMGWGK